MNITWTISSLDRRTSDGFIQVAHWNATGTEGEHSASVYATCSFADGEINIPYANVTEANVLEWCWANGVDKAAVEVAIADRIAELKAPKTAAGLPWGE